MKDIEKFTGKLVFTNPYAKCDPITISGTFAREDTIFPSGKPGQVWKQEKGLYADGINVEICEIFPNK